MANSNRIFVSPGVYTSEKDLTFVAQSVGVTTLGMAGETLIGPAFEPVLITNFDEFRTYFGNTSPEKFGNGNPRFELPYFAKSYLQESNQLFVTRVLGLTGYRPLYTWGVKTLGGVIVDTVTPPTPTTPGSIDPTDVTASAVTYPLLDTVLSVDGTTILEYIEDNFSTAAPDNESWFAIGSIPTPPIVGTELPSPLTGRTYANNFNNKEWFNSFFDGTDTVYSYLFVWETGATASFIVTQYAYGATVNGDYDDVVVASIRPRGYYDNNVLTHSVSVSSDVSITDSGNIIQNPLSTFVLTANGINFECSMDRSSTKYIGKVLGNEVFDKSRTSFPVYLHEAYPLLVSQLFEQGLIRGLSGTLVEKTESLNFIKEWDTPMSPMVVSEVRGGKVDDLFEILSISDGESANFQIKISIMNINLETGEFDLIVRDFNDTDTSLNVLERFTRCTMNPDLPGYIGRKIGTVDTEFEIRSKYIMLKLVESHPTDAIPSGFKGFTSNSANFDGGSLGSVKYKTEYFNGGDIIGHSIDGTPIITNGDRIRRVFLGLNTFDRDTFKFKGNDAVTSTFGFHLSVNASSVIDYDFQTTPYDLEGSNKGALEDLGARKFTFAVCGGFDGWDIYRNVRTNSDGFILGRSVYNSNIITSGGVFSNAVGNSDYYAFLTAYDTFSNPEAVDINVFTTPGINFFEHGSLTTRVIDMIERDRADSLYVINSPNVSSVDEVVGDLESIGLDTNYSATYWPWIQIRDNDNSTQLFIPPTGEVLKNIALTDNVAYPWFAVAGYSRGLVSSIKAHKKLTLDDRDELYRNRINPIATFSDTGTIIWGNKTLQVRESALDRINVRRLLLRARKLISAVAVRLLFDQNDEQVRSEFLRLVNPILDAIKRERGLTEFRVVVSNDPEDFDTNTLRGKIYIQPTRSLEFIDVEFILTPTGASFENI